MITRDWVWLITCLQGTEVCVCVHLCVGVYRHANAGLSIHVNTSKKRQRGWYVLRCPCRSTENGKTERSDWWVGKIGIQIKWRFGIEHACVKIHTHCSAKIWHIRQCVIFFFLPRLQKAPMVKCKKGESAKKKKYDLLDFFLSFYLTISSSYCKWNPIRSKRQILRLPSPIFSFIFLFKLSPDLIIIKSHIERIKDVLTVFAYALCVCVCV